jgi:predicted dehydrogenase
MITWKGMSCNDKKYYGRDRGVTIHGTNGTVLIDREGYQVFSLDDKKIGEFKTQDKNTTQDLLSMDKMTNSHFKNFVNAVRNGEKLHSPVDEGNISVTMLQLSNIAWKINHVLKINKEDGHIINDSNAMEFWKREYIYTSLRSKN